MKDLLKLYYKGKCETELMKSFYSDFSMFSAWYMLMLVTSKIPWRVYFVEGLQNYMENKSEGNEKKVIITDFNCTMEKKWQGWWK